MGEKIRTDKTNMNQTQTNFSWSIDTLKIIEILKKYGKFNNVDDDDNVEEGNSVEGDNVEEVNCIEDYIQEKKINSKECHYILCPICNEYNCQEEECDIEIERQDHMAQFWADF